MISVIICTYNRERYIGRVLSALSEEEFHDFEVIVVDNNSTDGTLQTVRDFAAEHPTFPVKILSEPRQGLSYARNTGIEASHGDLLAFLDDDAIPHHGYLANLARGMQTHSEAIGFGGRITPIFEDCSAPKWLCRWTMGWVSGLDKGEADCLFRSREFPIGANMGLRHEAFEKVGTFDTGLGRCGGNLSGGEEKDLFYRVQAQGGKIIYLPDVKVDHVIPQRRTTRKYVIEFAKGVGRSEKRRSLGEGTYPRRLLSELVKWAGTLVLFLGYLAAMRPTCAATLVLFRWHVSRELLRAK